MPKYIDAEKLPIAKMWVVDEVGWGASFYGVYKEDVDKAPVVDVVPVVHGQWIDCSNGWMCSVCERDNTHDKPYCPNCGARME